MIFVGKLDILWVQETSLTIPEKMLFDSILSNLKALRNFWPGKNLVQAYANDFGLF